MASGPSAALNHGGDKQQDGLLTIDSAEAATGRLGAVLGAPRTDGLVRLGRHGPWLATNLAQAKRVLTDAHGFDFPTTVSRHPDLSASRAETRTGHHVYEPLSPAQVDRGSRTFSTEWQETVASLVATSTGGAFDAMHVLRQPMARATCAAVLDDLPVGERDVLAVEVLAWIDALGPVISARRHPGRWSRTRRREARARLVLEATLAPLIVDRALAATPQVVATMLAAGVQVPIAAGAWLLVHLADHPGGGFDPDHVVWETLRVAPPTWLTARVTTARVEVAGAELAAGEVVLVSPLLLGRLPELVPGTTADMGAFDPERWRQAKVRPGAWLPFGAGAHACPGRTLGFRLLRELAVWAEGHELALTGRVTIDQSRGILPSPAGVTFSSCDTMRP